MFFMKLFENVRRPNVMNFTHSKCYQKLSNVQNKNLNITITVKTFKQQSTQNPHCNLKKCQQVKKTESLQVILFLQTYYFSLTSRRGRSDFCNLILNILLKTCPQVNQSWEVVPRKLDQFVWWLSVMKAKTDHSFSS